MSTPGAATAFLGETASAQSAQPAQPTNGHSAQGEELIAVPAGLFGTLIGTLGQVVGGAVGGKTGQTISGISGTVGQILPFSTVPSGAGGQQQEELIAVPAGLWGILIGSLGKTVGDVVGGKAGQAISGISGTVGQVLPFSTVPSGPGGQQQEELIAVPAGLWGSLIGTIGQAVGGVVGGKAGQTISGISGTVGQVLPFSTVPGGAGQREEMIAVPAGLWGSLIGTLGQVVGGAVGGKTGQTISGISGTVGQILPFSAAPGGQQQEELIAVPAGLWGSLIGTIGQAVGGVVGGKAGQTISGISGTVGQILPFSTVPGGAGQQEEMIAVPAGLWGSLIGSLGKTVGDVVGGKAGQAISGISGTVGQVLPFSVVGTVPR